MTVKVSTSDRYFHNAERLAAARSHAEDTVAATIRNARSQPYPWVTARVALTKVLLDLEGRVGSADPVLEPLRVFIASEGRAG